MIYTKKGDKGTTTLVGGRSVSKADMQVEVYGTVDELNSHIGLAMAFLKMMADCMLDVGCMAGTGKVAGVLEKIQKELLLFGNLYAVDMGVGETDADGQGAGAGGRQFSLPFITEENVNGLEHEINSMEKILPPLKDFILPNGNVAAAQLHVCRTVCRRLERLLVRFTIKQADERKTVTIHDNLALKYINRLSDYLFVAARGLNI
jgi:cob(I)alamin adenosyltransferase